MACCTRPGWSYRSVNGGCLPNFQDLPASQHHHLCARVRGAFLGLYRGFFWHCAVWPHRFCWARNRRCPDLAILSARPFVSCVIPFFISSFRADVVRGQQPIWCGKEGITQAEGGWAREELEKFKKEENQG